MAQGLTESPEAEAARLLAQEPLVRRVILFGSRARGYADRASDMDLAIDAPGLGREALWALRDAMDRRASLVPVDLVLLADAPETLRVEIDRTGVVLFERTQ